MPGTVLFETVWKLQGDSGDKIYMVFFCQGIYALEAAKGKLVFMLWWWKFSKADRKVCLTAFGEYWTSMMYFLYLWLWRPLGAASAVVAFPLNPSIATQLWCCACFLFCFFFKSETTPVFFLLGL